MHERSKYTKFSTEGTDEASLIETALTTATFLLKIQQQMSSSDTRKDIW